MFARLIFGGAGAGIAGTCSSVGQRPSGGDCSSGAIPNAKCQPVGADPW
jgi:hypothetical protein